MTRENHGVGNPYGSRVRVAPGTGTGWKFPTRKKPVPAGRVRWVGAGFFFVMSTRIPPPSRLPPPPLPSASDPQVTVAKSTTSKTMLNTTNWHQGSPPNLRSRTSRPSLLSSLDKTVFSACTHFSHHQYCRLSCESCRENPFSNFNSLELLTPVLQSLHTILDAWHRVASANLAQARG
jgi:hypothetical protein